MQVMAVICAVLAIIALWNWSNEQLVKECRRLYTDNQKMRAKLADIEKNLGEKTR